ncbi:hypothetical protein [Bartonella sp. AA97HXZ]|uniref:hypothetical protein n=1 Tax=Bartonella sp. AA97HXZ TaxID=1460972 RepID=UPI0035CEBD3A
MEKHKEATKSFFREAWQIVNSWFDICILDDIITRIVAGGEFSRGISFQIILLKFYIKGDICIIFSYVEEVDSVTLL